MGVELTKTGIDLGIVTANPEAMVGFYRDTLGFRQEPDTPFPAGGVMHRLWCGDSLIKIVVPDPAPRESAPPAPIPRANGYRYFTISVSNIDELTQACAAAGFKIAVPVTEVRPGVRISMIEDPDSNWVELLHVTTS